MNKNRPAYSLVFAFIIMTLIMVIASTSIQDTRTKIQLFQDLEANSQARLAAESAAELGIVDLKNSIFSAETEVDNVFCIGNSGTSASCNGTSEGKYTIYPYARTNSSESTGYYYIPIPGTGNAAPTEECSIADDPNDPNHSCNWNKLAVGQPISIPLYYDDGTGNISLPMSSGFNSWALKLRTPCENGDLTDNCDDAGSGTDGDRYRFEHNDSASDDSDGDGNLNDENRVIVFWEIAGYDSDGTQVLSAIPDDCVNFNTSIYMIDRSSCSTNTEIHEVHINDETDTGDYKQLNTSSHSALNSDLDYSSVEKLYLNLSIINDLSDDTGSNIPYLEYQFYISGTTPTISPISNIMGEGYYDSGDQTYYFPYSLSYSSTSESTTLYTLSN